MIGFWKSGYPMLFTDPVSERRQTRVSYEQTVSRFANKLFPKCMKKVTKFGLEALTGKILSVWLEFIDETGVKEYFVYKCKLRLEFATLFSWHVHK